MKRKFGKKIVNTCNGVFSSEKLSCLQGMGKEKEEINYKRNAEVIINYNCYLVFLKQIVLVIIQMI